MTVSNGSNGRGYIHEVGDTHIKRTLPVGYRKHWKITGALRSIIGLSFKDKDAGWVNKVSVVHYMKRNAAHLGFNQSQNDMLNQLSDSSSATDVKSAFQIFKVAAAAKASKVSPSIPEKPMANKLLEKIESEKSKKDDSPLKSSDTISESESEPVNLKRVEAPKKPSELEQLLKAEFKYDKDPESGVSQGLLDAYFLSEKLSSGDTEVIALDIRQNPPVFLWVELFKEFKKETDVTVDHLKQIAQNQKEDDLRIGLLDHIDNNLSIHFVSDKELQEEVSKVIVKHMLS